MEHIANYLLIAAIILWTYLLVQLGFSIANKIAFCRFAKMCQLLLDELSLKIYDDPVNRAAIDNLVKRFDVVGKEDKNFISTMYAHYKEHQDERY